MSVLPMPNPESQHDWVEVYYGWKCNHCDLFYAFGTAPWEDDEDDVLTGPMDGATA